MGWHLTLVGILLGALLPSALLWVGISKRQRGISFWELALIGLCGASVWQVPRHGMWLCLIAFLAFFFAFPGITRFQSLWMALVAYVACAAVGLSVAHLPLGNRNPETARAKPKPAERPVLPGSPARPPVPAMQQAHCVAESPRVVEAPEWLCKKYSVGGVAKTGGECRAVINGSIYGKGDEIGPGVVLVEVENDQVVIRNGDKLLSLQVASFL
jgi:hypothetical protein